MKQLDVYYRALLNYRAQTLENRDCAAQRNAITKVNTESDKIVLTRKICTVQEDWVDAIEKGLEFIEKAIKEDRQFIRSNGEVVPIEKVKHVSTESVRHLARHTNLIGKIEEGETPEHSARRELLEETGYAGGTWRQFFLTSANPTNHNNLVYTFLAEGVELVAEQHTEAGEDIEVHLMTAAEVRELLDTDEIIQCTHAAPLWRYFAENPITK